MLKQLFKTSLVLTSVIILSACNIDEFDGTTVTRTNANQVTTVNRSVAMLPSNTNNVVTTTRQSTVVVNQDRSYNSTNAPVQAVTVAPVKAQPIPMSAPEPVVRSTPSDVITSHNTGESAMSAPVIPVGGSHVSGAYSD